MRLGRCLQIVHALLNNDDDRIALRQHFVSRSTSRTLMAISMESVKAKLTKLHEDLELASQRVLGAEEETRAERQRSQHFSDEFNHSQALVRQLEHQLEGVL